MGADEEVVIRKQVTYGLICPLALGGSCQHQHRRRLTTMSVDENLWGVGTLHNTPYLPC